MCPCCSEVNWDGPRRKQEAEAVLQRLISYEQRCPISGSHFHLNPDSADITFWNMNDTPSSTPSWELLLWVCTSCSCLRAIRDLLGSICCLPLLFHGFVVFPNPKLSYLHLHPFTCPLIPKYFLLSCSPLASWANRSAHHQSALEVLMHT